MHRPGHVYDDGSTEYAMDRRKYLSTLAAGAALGTMAVGLAACGGGSSTQTERTAPEQVTPPDQGAEHLRWGILTLYPPQVTSIEKARQHQWEPNSTVLRIPFFNNTGIPVNEGDFVGFTLKKIGCPPTSVIAINLVPEAHDHDDPTLEERNGKMDRFLEDVIKIPRVPLTDPDQAPCDDQHAQKGESWPEKK